MNIAEYIELLKSIPQHYKIGRARDYQGHKLEGAVVIDAVSLYDEFGLPYHSSDFYEMIAFDATLSKGPE